MSTADLPDGPVGPRPPADRRASPRRRRPPDSPVARRAGDRRRARRRRGRRSYPPVVAVVVTRNPGPVVRGHARGARRRRTTPISPCSSSTAGPTTTPRRGSPSTCRARSSAASATTAGFAEAANEALHAVEGATFLLVCHDDVVPDARRVRALVEEAYRSNAGIVGPEARQRRRPGGAARGRPRHRPLRRAVHRHRARRARPGAARRRARRLLRHDRDDARARRPLHRARRLRSRDLPRRRGPRPLLAGPARGRPRARRARRARRAPRGGRGARQRATGPTTSRLARSRVRVLLTSYSLLTLLWLVPFGHRRRVRRGARRPRSPGTRGAPAPRIDGVVLATCSTSAACARRASARRRSRHVHDRELRELQVGERDPARRASSPTTCTPTSACGRSATASRSAVDSVSDGVRAPAAIAFLGFLVLVLFGSRDADHRRRPGDRHASCRWPGVGDLFDAFGSAWRYTGLGSASPAPSAARADGRRSAPCCSARSALARTLVVVAGDPARRVRRVPARAPRSSASAGPRSPPASRTASTRSPATRSRQAASVRSCCSCCCRSCSARSCGCRLDATPRSRAGARAVSADGPRAEAARRFLRLAVLAALAAAWYPGRARRSSCSRPPRFVLAVPIAGGSGRCAPRARHRDRRPRSARHRAAVPVAARVRAHAHFDAASLGFAFRPDLDLVADPAVPLRPVGRGLGDVGPRSSPPRCRCSSPPAPRLAWTARGWMLAVVGWAVGVGARTVLPRTRRCSRPKPGSPSPRSGSRSRSASAVSVLVDGIRTFRFGWRQPAAILGGVALLLPDRSASPPTRSTAGGTRRATDWTRHARLHASRSRPRASSGCSGSAIPRCSRSIPSCFATAPATRSPATAPATSPSSGARPSTPPTTSSTARSSSARDGLTNRLGRMLAPMGVRYVVLPSTQGTGRRGAARRSARAGARALDGAARPRAAALRAAVSCSTRTSRGSRCRPSVPRRRRPRVPIGSRRPDPRRARRRPQRARAARVRRAAPPGTCCGARRTTREWTATSVGHDARATSQRSGGRTATGSPTTGHRRRSRSPTSGSAGRCSAASLVIWLFVVVALAAHPRARVPRLSATATRSARERARRVATRSPTSSTRTRSGGSGCERPAPHRTLRRTASEADRAVARSCSCSSRSSVAAIVVSTDRESSSQTTGARRVGGAARAPAPAVPSRRRRVDLVVLRGGHVDARRSRRRDRARRQPRRHRASTRRSP